MQNRTDLSRHLILCTICNLICHGSNSPQLCCDQNFTEQSEVGANTPQLCCGEIYYVSDTFEIFLESIQRFKERLTKREEKTLLNRLVKYKANHLLFLINFRVHYSNNMREKDPRICKNSETMACGVQSASGTDMYCKLIASSMTLYRVALHGFSQLFEG